MQRPLGIWTNIAIVKLLMPLIVPRFGGPVKVKMVNIRTHFFYQLFKFAIFWENSRTLLPVYSTTKHWIVYKSYRIVEGVTLSDSRRSFDRFALKPLHYIIRCWATFIRFYYWTTSSRPISNILHIKAITELRHFHTLLTERRELTPVTIALVNKHHALSGEFI
jgi:hypothetical protein